MSKIPAHRAARPPVRAATSQRIVTPEPVKAEGEEARTDGRKAKGSDKGGSD